MGRCTESQGRMIINNFQQDIENIKYKISKNFSDMDLENNYAHEDIKEIIDQMKSECNRLEERIISKKNRLKG
ncbi:hypothetical protein [Faecalimicrobium sp. JNUCC 81]